CPVSPSDRCGGEKPPQASDSLSVPRAHLVLGNPQHPRRPSGPGTLGIDALSTLPLEVEPLRFDSQGLHVGNGEIAGRSLQGDPHRLLDHLREDARRHILQPRRFCNRDRLAEPWLCWIWAEEGKLA